MPVVPAVYSTTVSAGSSAPARSAPSITASAIRSFMLPVGLAHSSFASTRADPLGTTLRSAINGVPPIPASTPSRPRASVTSASRAGLAGEHAADQRTPGDRTHDAVVGGSDGLLKTADERLCPCAEDAVNLHRRCLAARLVVELDHLLHPAHRVARAASLHLHDQSRPRRRPDDPVGAEALLVLER